jgi:Alw26I/Eco31I/Esp3I family type II restriction endonuclease
MGRKAEYGRGAEAFLEYVRSIIEHPNYRDMPDLYNDKGHVQWEAPSNRKGGKFKDTHHKRRDWWRRKAVEIGIDPDSPKWISRVAKTIHPTKQKPCKNCGRVMDIRYAYPSSTLLSRIKKLDYIDESFPLDPLEHVTDLVSRLVDRFGDDAFNDLPKLFKTGSIKVPRLESRLDAWLRWITEEYIPSEPSTLSPGVMSNAPDRLEGFHSFNLCCRSKADTGRSRENLRSYTTDRRVFEYWVEGDWVAADRMMGLIRTDPGLRGENCANGHPGPCSADHIGPISLGFTHRPEFRLLCKACNSAKNNRMSLGDVELLRRAEGEGEKVVSWYCERLWDLRKGYVTDEETALRLSKLLRDNRHTVMMILEHIARAGHLTFLSTFLGIEYADNNITFTNLRAEDHATRFDAMERTDRATKYAAEQKARRFRVAFSALWDYVNKENRNALYTTSPEIEKKIREALCHLDQKPEEVERLDVELGVLLSTDTAWQDDRARELIEKVPSRTEEPESFNNARKCLVNAMALAAERLSDMWTDERYVRASLDDEFLSEAAGEVAEESNEDD